ncbi:unnamed protein product [Onchocerca flexuosa]|uniref:Uncharacterized protein n=1 Tax=Onchocerca flexuosa TaxID=387005 RepID=A0A183HJG6_9BILA|nr:unnamed protein product [Onchocerca flexuosa]
MGKTYRSRIDDPTALAQDHPQQQIDHFNSVAGMAVVQRSQNERVREPSSGLMMPTLEEKVEPNNGSVLHGVFNSSNTSPIDFGISDKTESRLNYSLNLNNQRGLVQRINRSSSIPPEGIHGNKYFSEDRFKRSGNTVSELTNQYRSPDK